MPRDYDPELCDYLSAWFDVGHREGFEGRQRLGQRPSDTLTDVEWASYCEGWHMGHCEGVHEDYPELNAKWYFEVAPRQWQIRPEMLVAHEEPRAHFERLKALTLPS